MSVLLKEEDFQLLYDLVGDEASVLASAVVQVFLTIPPRHDQWLKYDSGVLSLVKEGISYFFR